jgi:ketosteroid isomerase-like protein
MMSTNLDLVARIYEEFNETRELPRWAMSSDVEWYPPADEPDNAPRHGVEVVTTYVREWASTFTDYWCDVDELIERDGSVIAPLNLRGRIGGSTGELTIPLTQVWTIRDGHVVRVQEYRTKAEALTQ